MADIVACLKSREGGMLTLLADGSILAEGKYYILRDHDLQNSAGNVRIDRRDILRVGYRKYSSTRLIVSGLSVFGVGVLVYNLSGKILGKLSGVISTASDIKNATSAFIEYSDGFMENEAQTVQNAASDIITGSENLSTFAMFLAMALTAAAAVIMIKYLFSHRKYIEVNTEYGIFCIDRSGIPQNETDDFIQKYYNIKGR